MSALTQTDSYKLSHKGFMVPSTSTIYSNMTPRSSKYLPIPESAYNGKYVVFGLQHTLIDFIMGEFQEFFDMPMERAVGEAVALFDAYLGKGSVEADHFEQLHELGYLPVVIKALPEGTLAPIKIPMYTIRNTHPDFAWLTNYLETVMSCETWKAPTVATIAYHYRMLVNGWAMLTTGGIEGTEFQLHDFSFRGMSNRFDAAKSGAAFLLSSNGTDNIPALPFIENYYDTSCEDEFLATSVPASEHSLASTGIAVNGELETIRKWVTEDYPSGIVSVISDTMDFWKVLTEYLPQLKEDILNRTPNELGLAKTVIRPDCYDDKTQILTNSGWKYFKDLQDDDLVASVEDGEYSFAKPEKIIEQDYSGVMHHFKDHHGKVDLLVTPNHRMVLEQNGKERIVFAENLGSRGHDKQKMYRTARAKTTSDGISPLERLKIAFQADGSFCTDVKSSIRFSFLKERKIARMKNLLEDCGLEYIIYALEDGRSEFNIKIDSSKMSKNFDWVDTSNLCGLWCEGFIDELKHWDSSIRNEERFKFDTTNKSVVDVVEKVTLSAGYGIYMSKSEDTRSDLYNDVYTAHITKNNQVGGQSWTNTIVEEYNGKVYCVTVPSGKVVVKRNQCTMVCGNSGDPVKIVTGYNWTEVHETDLPEVLDDVWNSGFEAVKYKDNFYELETVHLEGVPRTVLGKVLSEFEVDGAVQVLYDLFGGDITDKGYLQLHERIGLIYGDSMNYERIEAICKRLAANGFASTNVIFGIGSFTMQYMTRDTLGMAVKATYAEVGGVGYNLFKDPATDDGTKKSAKGLLRVDYDESGEIALFDEQTWEQEAGGLLETVFEDGELKKVETYSEIRNRLWSE